MKITFQEHEAWRLQETVTYNSLSSAGLIAIWDMWTNYDNKLKNIDLEDHVIIQITFYKIVIKELFKKVSHINPL